MLKSPVQRYKLHRDPIKLFRSQGMVIGDRCEIDPSASFGADPYWISPGDHVRVNSGVTHWTGHRIDLYIESSG